MDIMLFFSQDFETYRKFSKLATVSENKFKNDGVIPHRI